MPAKTAVSGMNPRPVNLTDLIEVGLLDPPVRVRATYLKFDFAATITAEGAITFRGKTYRAQRGDHGTPLSTVASIAATTVRKPPVGRQLVPVDGWLFWRFRDREGKLVPLDALRREFVEQNLRP